MSGGMSDFAADTYRSLGLVPDDLGERLLRDENHTDAGNARRLVARHGKDLRYVYAWGRWIVWDETRWRVDDGGEVVRRAKETARATYHKAGSGGLVDKKLAEHAMRSESRRAVDAMIYLAQSEPGVAVRPEDLDAEPFLLNAANGTVDLRTGELKEHRRGDLMTKIAPVDYDPQATAPTFDAFLERILSTKALRKFVQRVLGYAAVGENSEEVLVILHGTGANGKSTLVNAAMQALGGYAMQAAPDLLLAKRDSHPTELADLFGARFVASVETDEGRRLAEGLVKQLTGRDPIKARRMREDFWQFEPTHTVFLATNHRPEVRGTDHAIWRRIKLVPFDIAIPEAEQDKRLAAKLRDELPGILAWIVRGHLEYQREGLGEPEEVKAATAGYRSDMDLLAAFIEERCVVRDGVWVKFVDLYRDYEAWCQAGNEQAKTKRQFGTLLKDRGFEPDRGTGNAPVRRGIALREGNDPGPEGGDEQGDRQDSYPSADSRVTNSGDSYPNARAGNADSHAGNGAPSYQSYREGGMNASNSLHEDLYPSKGNLGNLGNGNQAVEDIAPPAHSDTRQQGSEEKGGREVDPGGVKPAFGAGGSAPGVAGGGNDVVYRGREELADLEREREARQREDFCRHGEPGEDCPFCEDDYK